MEDADKPENLVELTFEETRVLGSLIEKELTTPEYYPMSLNGLVNACNQKNNRLPKTNLDEDEVNQVIEELRIKRLVHRVDLVGSRVPKFQHNAEKELDLIKAERALLAELLNRGPQTTGELNNRASRMFAFDGIADVEETLQELMDREPALVGNMDPAPGQKEKRWFHRLAPPPVLEEMSDGGSVYIPGPDKRIDQIEEMTKEFTELKDEVETLRYQLREISDEFKNFRKQFE
ncbi:YceH family protein [Opitutales bacterium]|nr:YceH family protein [Opitutales bacterium]